MEFITTLSLAPREPAPHRYPGPPDPAPRWAGRRASGAATLRGRRPDHHRPAADPVHMRYSRDTGRPGIEVSGLLIGARRFADDHRPE